MKKDILILLLFIFFLSIFLSIEIWATEKVEIYFFYSSTCPHCIKEKTFLKEIEKKYSQIEIKKFDIFEKKNVELLEKFYRDYKVPSEIYGYVPITFIKERYFLGFNDKIAKDIENYILELLEGVLTPVIPESKISLPVFGEVDISNYSLPILAVVLGFFDGFNVCSLASLVLILGLVLALRSRTKILILGGVFILITAIVYGILIFLWHQIFIVLSPFLRKMEILIGILAIFGGVYFLNEFLKFRKRGPVCEFGGISEKFSKKVQEAFKQKRGILTLILAISSFAGIITIVEFPCSAVLPVLFAGILKSSQLSLPLVLIYVSVYLLFYLLDEIFVFLISVLTLRLWIASPKFITWLNLIAAIILFFLGFYYLFSLI